MGEGDLPLTLMDLSTSLRFRDLDGDVDGRPVTGLPRRCCRCGFGCGCCCALAALSMSVTEYDFVSALCSSSPFLLSKDIVRPKPAGPCDCGVKTEGERLAAGDHPRLPIRLSLSFLVLDDPVLFPAGACDRDCDFFERLLTVALPEPAAFGRRPGDCERFIIDLREKKNGTPLLPCKRGCRVFVSSSLRGCTFLESPWLRRRSSRREGLPLSLSRFPRLLSTFGSRAKRKTERSEGETTTTLRPDRNHGGRGEPTGFESRAGV